MKSIESMESGNIILKKDYKVAVHSTKYGSGRAYTLYIGLNPFGPCGGKSGIVVDAAYSYYFHCKKVRSYRISYFIEEILKTIKQLDICELPINFREYCNIFDTNKNNKDVTNFILQELLKDKEYLYKAFLFEQKTKDKYLA